MIPYRLTVTDDRPEGVSIRNWRKISRAAMTKVGVKWHRDFMPKHFASGATRRYGYKRRSKKWREFKQRSPRAAKGGRAPLVFEGDAEQAARVATIRGFPSRATVNMILPSYFTINPSGLTSAPDMVEELTTHTDPEVNTLSEIHADEIVRRQNRLKKRTRTRIG